MTEATRHLAQEMAAADVQIERADDDDMAEHWRQYREFVAYRRYVLLRQEFAARAFQEQCENNNALSARPVG